MNQPFISLPVASEVIPSISEIYTGGKNVEKKSICLSFNIRPSSGNLRLTSRFGSMGWIINANVSTVTMIPIGFRRGEDITVGASRQLSACDDRYLHNGHPCQSHGALSRQPVRHPIQWCGQDRRSIRSRSGNCAQPRFRSPGGWQIFNLPFPSKARMGAGIRL